MLKLYTGTSMKSKKNYSPQLNTLFMRTGAQTVFSHWAQNCQIALLPPFCLLFTSAN